MSCDRCPCPAICPGSAAYCRWMAAIDPDPIKIRHICRSSAPAPRALSALPHVPSSPGFLSTLSNAASAATRAIVAVSTGRPVLVDQVEQDRRLEICRACEHFDGSKCKICGCFARFKKWLATEKCPIGKW